MLPRVNFLLFRVGGEGFGYFETKLLLLRWARVKSVVLLWSVELWRRHDPTAWVPRTRPSTSDRHMACFAPHGYSSVWGHGHTGILAVSDAPPEEDGLWEGKESSSR